MSVDAPAGVPIKRSTCRNCGRPIYTVPHLPPDRFGWLHFEEIARPGRPTKFVTRGSRCPVTHAAPVDEEETPDAEPR